MEVKSLNLVKLLEDQLLNSYSLPIFRGYKAVNKTGIEKLVNELYSTLPKDIIEARKFLDSKNVDYDRYSRDNKMYEAINTFEKAVQRSLRFANFSIVYVSDLENLITRLYKSVPDELIEMEKFED